MSAYFDKIFPHYGHNLTVALYGDESDPEDVTIECEDCHEVLVSVDTDGEFECPRCCEVFRGCDRQEATVIADHGHCWSCQQKWKHGEPLSPSGEVEIKFRNYYRCPCGEEWQDEWDSTCDDRCPKCDTSMTPYASEDI